MLPAIERLSGRSRYTSATRSSSRTATRCSPTSTETRSSRFAAGSGARFGGWRRHVAEREPEEERDDDLRSGLRSGVFFSAAGCFAAGLSGLAGFSAPAAVSPFAAAAVVPGFLRPLPPREPRRRLRF